MNDENQIDPEQVHPDETEVVDSPPVAQHPAHAELEDPEEHIGDETPDPWDDSKQSDWPNMKVNSDEYVAPTAPENQDEEDDS